jgi:hypothetical protein
LCKLGEIFNFITALKNEQPSNSSSSTALKSELATWKVMMNYLCGVEMAATKEEQYVVPPKVNMATGQTYTPTSGKISYELCSHVHRIPLLIFWGGKEV